VKAKSIWMMALWVAGVGGMAATPGCQKEDPGVAASAKAKADRAAADKAAAEKAAALDKAEVSNLPPDLVEMKAEITRMTAQIDLTMARLDTLMASTGDLDKPTEAAQGALRALDTEAQNLKQRGEQMRDRGAAYFEVWEKQLASMSTPEVTAIATKRKEELAKKYSEVLLAMQETRAALDAYLGDMKTIRTAVDAGMTPDKQKLLTPQVKTAKEKAATLNTRVDATFTKLGQVSQIYAQR
jgi:chromosome segregation ATPase